MRIPPYAILAPLALGFVLGLPPTAASAQCLYLSGPEEPIPFGPDPNTGFIVLTLPLDIGADTYTADIRAAILGFLETAQDGSPRRALQTQTWVLRETGQRLEWTGDTRATPTDDPAVVDYTLQFDLAAASARIVSGVAFARGQINLLDNTGYTADLFGRVCIGRDR